MRSTARRSTRSEPGQHGQQDGEAHCHRHHHDLRADADAEPEQDERRIADHGHRIDRGRQRQDCAAQCRNQRDGDGKANADQAAEPVADQRFEQGVAGSIDQDGAL